MTYAVIVVARAQRQVDRYDRWWQANRPAAPNLFLDEFDHAVERSSTLPESGPVYQSGEKPVRYLLLPRTRYLVYYRVDHAKSRIRILHVRSAVRGSQPHF